MKNKLYKKFIHTLAKAKIKSMKKKAEKKENKKHDKKEKNSSDEQIRSVVESDDSNKYSEELGIKELRQSERGVYLHHGRAVQRTGRGERLPRCARRAQWSRPIRRCDLLFQSLDGSPPL